MLFLYFGIIYSLFTITIFSCWALIYKIYSILRNNKKEFECNGPAFCSCFISLIIAIIMVFMVSSSAENEIISNTLITTEYTLEIETSYSDRNTYTVIYDNVSNEGLTYRDFLHNVKLKKDNSLEPGIYLETYIINYKSPLAFGLKEPQMSNYYIYLNED